MLEAHASIFRRVPWELTLCFSWLISRMSDVSSSPFFFPPPICGCFLCSANPSNLQPVQHFALGLPLWCLPAGISTCPGAPRTMAMEHKGKQLCCLLQKMIDLQLSVYNHHSPVVLVKVKLSKDTLKDYSTFLKYSTMLSEVHSRLEGHGLPATTGPPPCCCCISPSLSLPLLSSQNKTFV